MEDEVKPNPEVELKECRIISQYFEKNDKNETVKDIKLPTPESLEKLCIPKIVQDSLTFDIQKYKSFLEVQKKENAEDEEKTILDKISFIKMEIFCHIF